MIYGLYLHIPFCRVRCTYCHFNTYTGLEDLYQSYAEALAKEIRLMGRHRGRPPVKTIFLGGGTPTVLSIVQLALILRACQETFTIAPAAEITIEANPCTLDIPYLRALHRLGINRLSFGAQSFNPQELALMGRDHTADAIGETVVAARQAGFTNLSFDLIYGLPTQTLETWQQSVSQAIALNTEHLSLYGLTIDSGTALRASVQRGDLPEPDPDLAADMYDLADDLLRDAGYQQYEISNWCQLGYESRHNLIYWRNQPYLGCGPGAHSFEHAKRWWNVRPVPKYIDLLTQIMPADHPHPSLAGEEKIDVALEMGETMIMGLRLLKQGLSIPEFEARFGVSMQTVYGSQITKLKSLNLLQETDGRLFLRPQARLISNRVFLHFLPD